MTLPPLGSGGARTGPRRDAVQRLRQGFVVGEVEPHQSVTAPGRDLAEVMVAVALEFAPAVVIVDQRPIRVAELSMVVVPEGESRGRALVAVFVDGELVPGSRLHAIDLQPVAQGGMPAARALLRASSNNGPWERVEDRGSSPTPFRVVAGHSRASSAALSSAA